MPWNREGQRTKQSAKETTITNQARKVLLFHYLDQELVSYLVLWAQSTTKDYIRAVHKLPSYSFHKSSYHKSCFLSLFIFRRHSTRELACGRVTYFILRAYVGTSVSHSQPRKNRERFWKNAGEWTGRVSVACMVIYWPTPGFKGRTFKLCVLTRWDFNFCVRGSPLRGPLGRLTEIY